MKKNSIITIIIGVAVILIACVAAYFIFTKNYEKKLQQEKADYEEYQRQMTEPIYTLENYPKVDASLATQPLTNAFIKNRSYSSS